MNNEEKSFHNGGACGTLLTDLLKAFNCLSVELLKGKLDNLVLIKGL